MPSGLVLPLLLGSAFALQPPGQFHGNEPVARDGERWLALRVDGDDAALVMTTLAVRAVEDPVLDAAGQRSGLLVSSADDGAIVMYLRGAGLRGGRIERARFEAHSGPLQYEIHFRGQPYRIKTQCDATPFEHVEAQAHYACRIVLDDGDRAQALAAMSGYYEAGATTISLGDDASPRLLFAGDIDRDGKLDLILDTTDHYNASRPTLFLSSQALPDGAVRDGKMLDGKALDGMILEVAHYDAIGC